MEPVKLQGRRLVVRDWHADEAEGRYRIFGNPEVRRFLSFGVDSIEEAAAELGSVIASQSPSQPRPSYFLAVELIATGRKIGNVGFEYRGGAADDGTDVAEIGYFSELSAWGCGYATEASMLIIEYAFSLGAATVIAECDQQNVASEAVMRRCGMSLLEPISPGRVRYTISSPAP